MHVCEMPAVTYICIHLYTVSIDLSDRDGPVNTEISVETFRKKKKKVTDKAISPVTMLILSRCNVRNVFKIVCGLFSKEADEERHHFRGNWVVVTPQGQQGCSKSAGEETSCETSTWATAMNNLTASGKESCCWGALMKPAATLWTGRQMCSMWWNLLFVSDSGGGYRDSLGSETVWKLLISLNKMCTIALFFINVFKALQYVLYACEQAMPFI